jgi:hypothetical protein
VIYDIERGGRGSEDRRDFPLQTIRSRKKILTNCPRIEKYVFRFRSTIHAPSEAFSSRTDVHYLDMILTPPQRIGVSGVFFVNPSLRTSPNFFSVFSGARLHSTAQSVKIKAMFHTTGIAAVGFRFPLFSFPPWLSFIACPVIA